MVKSSQASLIDYVYRCPMRNLIRQKHVSAKTHVRNDAHQHGSHVREPVLAGDLKRRDACIIRRVGNNPCIKSQLHGNNVSLLS